MTGPVTALLFTLMRRRAQFGRRADHARDEHRQADDEPHEDRAARPQHLADREIEDPHRGIEEAGDDVAGRVAGSAIVSALHQVLEHGLQVVVGRRHFLDGAARAARRPAR